ncbi:hypothetical protein KP509_14G078600 [Ceratopteris richardii]|uniref:Uncharacterized protein n=1 Tax=Ceratopteris richardii TaxID=49495 RepID=A0A8T2TB61_CERRI|nr:hypothetical protein KP509_14G078600 [Ceratopteris richardii]
MKTRSQTRSDRAVPVDRRKCDGSAGSDSARGNKQRKIAATCELNNASTVLEAGSASNLHGEILPGVLATDELEDAGRTSRAKSKRHFNGRAVDVPSRASQSPVALKKGILPNLCVEELFSNSDEQRGTQVQGVSVDPSTSLYSQSTDEVESCGNLALQDHGTQPFPYQNRFSIIQHFQWSSHIEETTDPLLEYTGVPNESDEGHQNEPTPTAQSKGRGNHSRSSRKKMQILFGSTAVQHNQSPSQIEETTVPLPEYRGVSNESDECCQNEPNPTAQSKGGEPHSRSSRKKMKFLPSANRTCKMKSGSQSQSNLAKPNQVSLFQLQMEENQHTCEDLFDPFRNLHTQGKSDLELQSTLPCQGNDVQAVAVSLHEQSSPAEHNGAASQIRQTAVSSQELINVHAQTDKGCQNEVASDLNHGGVEEDVQASRKKKRVVSLNDKSSRKKLPKRLHSDLAKQKCASLSQYATEECQQIIQNKFGVCNGMHVEEIVGLEQCRTLSSEHNTLKPLQEESCEQNIVNSFQRSESSNRAYRNAAQSLNLAGVHLQAEVYDREKVSLIHEDDQAIECLQSSNDVNQISPLDNHSHKNKSCTRSHEDSGVQDQLCLCQQSHKKRQRMKKHGKVSSETSKRKLRRPSIKYINATKSRWKQLAQTILSSKASLEGAIPNDELRVAVSRYGFSQDILNARDQSGNLDNSQSHMMRGRLPKKRKVSPKNNNILGSAKQSVSLKRGQAMSRQRQRLLGWMTTWLTQANFLEVCVCLYLTHGQ